jgi:UDP-glucose 4-epimerase
MKALVTGISGRIGANLAVALMKKGYAVRGLVMPGDPKIEKARRLGVEVVEADLGDAAGVHLAVDGVDVVAHLAAVMIQGTMPSERMVTINTLGTLNLLEGVLKSSTPLRRFLYASTDQTYSPYVLRRTSFHEDHPQKPDDLYGLAKFLSEQTCLEFMREYALPVTIVRFSSVVACDEVLSALAPAEMKFVTDFWSERNRVPWFGKGALLESQKIIEEAMKEPNAVCGVTGPDGTPWTCPYTDVRDSVQGAILALESPEAAGDIFNLVGPVTTSYVAAAKTISEKTGRPYRDMRLPFLWAFSVSIDKARTVLGYNPQFDFPKMVEDALAFRRGENIGVVPV